LFLNIYFLIYFKGIGLLIQAKGDKGLIFILFLVKYFIEICEKIYNIHIKAKNYQLEA